MDTSKRLYGSEIKKRELDIKGIFHHVDDLCVYEDYADFEIEHSEVTFEKLEKLSVLCNTKKINFYKGYYSEGCETCGHGETAKVRIVVEWND